MDAEMVIARARACVGARFRLHGRDPATGLDCVGVAAFACGIVLSPGRYALRGGTAGETARMIGEAGLEPVVEGIAGDVLLVAPGARQFHLVVLGCEGFIHADARLRRVVEVPGRPDWPVCGAWRIAERF